MAFLENKEEYMQWGNETANDVYLNSLDRFMYNMSDTTWNNASGNVRKTIIGTMDPSVPLDYGGKKVGGRCKVKIRTGYSKFTCRGRYDQSGRCIPCDNADVPRTTIDGPVRGGGSRRRPRGRFLRFDGATATNNILRGKGGFSNAAGVNGRQKGSNYVCDGCPDSGDLCSGPSDTSCPEGCSCKYGGPRMVQRASNNFRNASGCGYSNAAGGPVINVGGDTYDMQPTLAWNQGNFFGQTQGFGAGNLVCEACPRGFRGTRQACGGTGCYNRLGQRLAEAGTGIPPGMSVQYTQV